MILGGLHGCVSFVFASLHQPAMMQRGSRNEARRRHASAAAQEPFERALCERAAMPELGIPTFDHIGPLFSRL